MLRRSLESSSHNARFRGGKINIRGALPAPGAATRFENRGCLLNKCALLLRRELYHAPVFVGHTQRCENPSGDTEIWVIHVRPLDSRRNFQCHLSKVVGSHFTGDVCLTRHKMSDREPCNASYAAKVWMANTQKVDRSAARCIAWLDVICASRKTSLQLVLAKCSLSREVVHTQARR